jgi:hypothetical protein
METGLLMTHINRALLQPRKPGCNSFTTQVLSQPWKCSVTHSVTNSINHKPSTLYIYIYRTHSLDCTVINTFLKKLQNILFPKLLHFTLTITPTPILGKRSPLLLLPMPSTCSTFVDNLYPFWCRLHYVYIQM